MIERRTVQLLGLSDAGLGPEFALRLLVALAANVPTILLIGWSEPLLPGGALRSTQAALLGAYLLTAIGPLVRGGGRRRMLDELGRIETACAVLGLALAPFGVAGASLCAAGLFGGRMLAIYQRILRSSIPGPLVLVGSFGLLIVGGALALLLPAATPPGSPIGVVDAFFTSTSAVCVTGLIVRDTATEFTRFGQVVIMVLIQLGGLGIVVFGAIFALLMGGSLGLRATQTVAGAAGAAGTPAAVRRLVVFVASMTIVTEIVGALALYFGWPGEEGWATSPEISSVADRAFHAAFFSISAFNNAGFATTTDSLRGLQFHWTSHTVIASLIVLGGIGFPVLDEMSRVAWARMRGKRIVEGRLVRLSLHSKLVLATSVCLYLAGVIGITLSQVALAKEPIWQSLLDGHFMSITARTAGFETVAPVEMGPLARFQLAVLMFIGGSPGSTAGGAKTIVFAVLVLTVWATMNGRDTTQAFGRSLPDQVVRKCATFVTLHLLLVAAITAALAITERHSGHHDVERLVFEATSACSTVGLSIDLTSHHSPAGRVVVIAGMFLGRVGLLAVLVGIVSVARDRRARYSYPTEGVLMS